MSERPEDRGVSDVAGDRGDRGDEIDGGSGAGEILAAVLQDTERLAAQHADLLRAEVRRELAEAGLAATLGTGAGLAAAAGALTSLMIVHKLHRSTRLPLWGCYGLVGGALGALGAGLIASGLERAAGVNLVPRETLAALREDFQWVKDQAARFSS